MRERLTRAVASPMKTDVNDTVRQMVTHENANYARIWSTVESAYWAFCLSMSLVAPDFRMCRGAYAISLAMCLAALATVLSNRRSERAVRISAHLTQSALLVAGVLIAGNLAPKTIVVFASTLLVPVMFMQPTMISAGMLVMAIALFAATGKDMDPGTYFWVLSNQMLFSSIGIILGHVVNRTRFERNTYAESALRLAQEQSEFARRDQLTGLGNRLAYHETLETLEHSPQPGLYVVIADIDRLKSVNDNLGHEAGDEMIAGAATLIRDAFSDTSLVFRTGGDEFCVIGTGDAAHVEARIRALSDTCATWHGALCDHVSVSCGFAIVDEGTDVEAAVSLADANMYARKPVSKHVR